MIDIDLQLTPGDLPTKIEQVWELAGPKILSINRSWNPQAGTPVMTVEGIYQPQGWTEWTQGFQFGCSLMQFEATDDQQFLDMGRENTWRSMASHVSHVGVHDHGFNNISTYGNLRRLMLADRIDQNDAEMALYELALKTSAAVQAARWTTIADGTGFIYSFNGPHSLFCDTIRSLRSLAMGHQLEHVLMGEGDRPISLIERLLQHASNSAKYCVYYGEGRDLYDCRGRVAHESLFNVNNGTYRCPSTQQGYSPFTTWTRGLSWIVLGYPEQLQFLASLPDEPWEPWGGWAAVETPLLNAARAACDFYIEQTPTDGIPYWDTGAPGLSRLGDYLQRAAEPVNDYEPVDSSAAAIAAQGLLRLGRYLIERNLGNQQAIDDGQRYIQAGLTVSRTLLGPNYLNQQPSHQGLLLHQVYHRPRGWDQIPTGSRVPNGQSCMWGDYHLMELALYLKRLADNAPEYRFFAP